MIDLSKLQDKQPVKVRLARGDIYDDERGCYTPNWKPWRDATLWLVRREKPLPGARGKRLGGRVGDIIGLTIREVPWAEYTQADFCPEDDTFLAEDYRMEIKVD